MLRFADDEAKTQATVLVTYTSDRVSARSSSVDLPDLVQDPGVRLDFVLRQGFTILEHDFVAAFEARNLTGTDSKEFQEAKGKRFNTNSYDVGQNYSVSLTAKF